MAVMFSCPECGKQLRSANPIAPGKKAKCPACAAVFTPEVEVETVTAVQAKTPVKGSLPGRSDEDDDRPSARTHPDRGAEKKAAPRPRVEDEEEGDEAPPPRRRRHDEDDEPRGRRRPSPDEDEYDDRPRRKKKSKKAASNLPLILGISGGAALLLIILALTAFVWPGFLLSPDGAAPVTKADQGKKGGMPVDKGGMPGGFGGGGPGGNKSNPPDNKADGPAVKDKGGFPQPGGKKDGFADKDKGGFPQPGGNQGKNALANTAWSGSENLQGYGELTFEFAANNQVTMVDKDGRTPGTYQLAGNIVTIQIRIGDEGVDYQGTINGNTMSGTANNGKVTWKWSVKKK